MKDQTIKEIKEARDRLGETIMKEVQKFQQETGHMIGAMNLKIVRTPQGAFQDLMIDVDVFDDLKPKPKSNIVQTPGLHLPKP